MTDKRVTAQMMKRMRITLIIALVCFAIIAGRIFYMQVIHADFYQSKAANNQTRDKILYPARGTIYDTNMKPLAISATVEKLSITPTKIKTGEQREKIASGLTQYLEMSYEEILEKISKNVSYVVIKRGIEKDTADEIRRFIKDNELDRIMFFENDSKRYYPYGNFLSHVLGFVGSDEQGLSGLEIYYEKELSGTTGRSVKAVNARGEEMPFEYEMYYEAQDGHNLVLTIDEVLQHYLEKNLEIAYNDNKVRQSTIGVVMDVNTGGVLAMASYPDFDPNNPRELVSQYDVERINAITDETERAAAKSEALNKQWGNKAVSFTYYPGSTFKPITASAALEEGAISDTETFRCNGRYVVGSRAVSCWKPDGSHKDQNVAKALQNSCNPALMQIAFRLGKEKFQKYVEAYGLRNKTGIDLPGEALGLFNLQMDIDLAVYSFGQNFTLTPIQLITAISAIANGGTLLKPHIVKEVLDSDGNVVKSFGREEVRQVISKELSEKMCYYLEDVVTYGTGKNAYVPGYRVCGKTGTTEKIADQKNGEELRITSFVAFAPANDPQIAVLILLDEPTAYPISGGLNVAPVIRRFLEEAMPYLGIEPQYTASEMKTKDVTMPNLIGKTLDKANASLKSLGLYSVTRGNGEVVTDQLPAAGSVLSSGANVILYMGSSAPTTPITMPDLSGMTLDRAQRTLQNVGLFCRILGAKGTVGNIVVTKQNVSGGQTVTYGDVITIELSDMDQRAG